MQFSEITYGWNALSQTKSQRVEGFVYFFFESHVARKVFVSERHRIQKVQHVTFNEKFLCF